MNLAKALEELEKYHEQIPVDAVEWLEANWDQAETTLLEVIDNAIAEPLATKGKLFFWALHACAVRQSEAAFERYVRLCRLPTPQLDHLLGDILTEYMDCYLGETCAGRIDELKALIEDSTVYDFARAQALNALGYICFNHQGITRDDLFEYCCYLLNEGLERNDSYIWDETVSVCIDIWPGSALPLIRRAYEFGLVDTGIVRWSDVVEESARDGSPEKAMARNKIHYKPVEPLLKVMTQWKNVYEERLGPPDEEELLECLDDSQRIVPVYSGPDAPGRNDKCPCGSGRKFKKCCLNRSEPAPYLSVYGDPIPEKDVELSRWLEAGYKWDDRELSYLALECWKRFWHELKTRIPDTVKTPTDKAFREVFEGYEKVDVWIDDMQRLCSFVGCRRADAALDGLAFAEEILSGFPDIDDSSRCRTLAFHAQCQAGCGYFDKAIAESEKIIAEWPRFAIGYIVLADLLAVPTDRVNLTPDYEKALELLQTAQQQADHLDRWDIHEHIAHIRQLSTCIITDQAWAEALHRIEAEMTEAENV